ncbi:hypothetical protein [Pseudomonas sp. KU43P]|uniref:DUF7338 family protein n=1 Tax=Pseudomonas sp. KU43P TaxID=2487887 RepID=UPI0012A83BA0|nr:hypothetical protein [Pseudomonas sp. KU43P]BBH44754.1 hypothetical protein KU43P_12310 [Pseudomonas sp. KU43P]
MLKHVFLAAPQWLLLFPVRVALILIGLVVVPLAMPLLVTEGPPVPFTQAPGNWQFKRLPAWAWLWSNDRDGAAGDKRGWWHLNAPFGLGAYHPLSMFVWLALRNPANNMRFTRWLGCPVTECDYRYWGDENVEDRPGEGGRRLLLATHKKTGRRYYGFYGVWEWSTTRAVVIQIGFKGEPKDWAEDYTGDLSRQWAGMTFEINLFKDIS